MVDDSPAARARIVTLLHLGGWRVHQVVGTDGALRLAALVDPDLVVTEMVMRNGHGATLMRRLREQGSTARFLVVAARRTQQCRTLAAGSGALACLAKPVDPRLFVDVLRGLAPVSASAPSYPTAPAGSPSEQMFLSALPHRLSTIAAGTQAGNAEAVAAAADAMAADAERFGHAEVAFLSSLMARDARRGQVTHGRLVALIELCARIDTDAVLTLQAVHSA